MNGVSESRHIDGIVTLNGETGSYAEKWQAQRTVERVSGVTSITNEIEVRSTTQRRDTEVARSAVNAIRWKVMVPSDHVTVKVDKGWLTLRGDVRWDDERQAAETSATQPARRQRDLESHCRPTAGPAQGREGTTCGHLQARSDL
jgi:osmotically-inducible protein OsmY